MNPSGGYNAELSADTVHTAIDDVLYQKFQAVEQPHYVRATDPFWFKQGKTIGNAFIFDVDSDVGDFEEGEDQAEITDTDSLTGNTKTIISKRYFKQVPISFEAFKADRHDKRAKIGEQIGGHARQTQDKRAILDTYGDAFAGSVNTCDDGVALASASHLTLKGATIDNLETGSLSPDNLWTDVTTLANMKGQDGDAGSFLFEGSLVPFTLYKTLKEVTGSVLLADSTENNLNIFDSDFGNIKLGASIFLGSTYNSATNANTSYHVLSSSHEIHRKVFYDLFTVLIPPENTRNHSYVLRALFNEKSFPGTYSGYVGSNGTT